MPGPQSGEPPIGEGPLEQVLQRWNAGEIGEQVALEQAAEPDLVAGYDSARILALSDATVRLGYDGRWELARDLHRLIRACHAAAGKRLRASAVPLAAHHLRVATNALCHRPDVAVFREALDAGLAAHGQAQGSERGSLAHLLGILYLDPWTANRPSPQALKLWWHAAVDAESSAPRPGGLPDALSALHESERWLRQALDDVQGVARLETLKALLQCLYAREIHGEKVDDAVARPLLDEALELAPLAPKRADLLAFLQQLADRLQVDAELEDLGALAARNWERDLAALGVVPVIAQLTPALVSGARRDPAAGLRLAARVACIFEDRATEAQRIQFYSLVVEMLAGGRAEMPADRVGVEEALEQLASASREDHSALCTQLLSWARGLPGGSNEDLSLKILQGLARAAPDLWQAWGNALNHFGGQLHVGAAVNALEAGDRDGAVSSYFGAWGVYGPMGLVGQGLNVLRRIADILPGADPRSAQILCELLREQPAPEPAGFQDAWQEACAQLAAASLRCFTAQGASADAWFASLRLAKGPAFANLVANAETYDWHSDPVAVELRSKIRDLEDSADLKSLLEPGAIFDHALICHRSTPLVEAGKTAAEQRDNLARRFDLHVQGELARRSRVRSDRFTAADACQALPKDAVLLDFYQPGPGIDAPAICLVLTKESQKVFVLVGPPLFQAVAIEGSTANYFATEAGMLVEALREAIPGDPEGDQAAAAGALRWLDLGTQRFLGPAVGHLDSLWALGKRQLLVVPSGPLHFFPLHLLGRPGATLADRWTVTYLSSADLLRRARQAHARPRHGQAFGLGYAEGPTGRAPLPGALREARAIAYALGVEAVLDEAVTRGTVVEALRRGGLVHVACHGCHDVVAPSLQSLELAPEGADDGRLASVDLHALDLSGLSVLSLGACETALGRFDAGDNLRGLLASALAAGAGCVVGTLWLTNDGPAEIFFVRLFTELAAGSSRAAAFRKAQLETRAAFPEYRHWGPFYMAGAPSLL